MPQIQVVIAEDDEKIAEIQRRFIERVEGFQVAGIAHRPGDAAELVEVLQPELLLLDVHFPEGSGLELLRQLRAENSVTDVILITAAKETSTLTEAMRCGVFDYILKPIVFDRLQETLNAYRDQRVKLQELNTLNQQDVDKLIPRGTVVSAPTTAQDNKVLPKGIDALTLHKIRSTFAENKRLSLNAEEVGERVGASRTTARRYLEFMVSEGELQADVSYGSVGRPERRYVNSSSQA